MDVLFVGHDGRLGARIRSWLVDAGHDVLQCRGPCAPTYVCAAGRGRICPFPGEADVVVLDCRLASDLARRGTPSSFLLAYYRRLGVPVVALEEDGTVVPRDGVEIVPRSVDVRGLTEAIDRVTEEAGR